MCKYCRHLKTLQVVDVWRCRSIRREKLKANAMGVISIIPLEHTPSGSWNFVVDVGKWINTDNGVKGGDVA